MSGTSLDGVDLAACRFWQDATQWHYEILASETVGYSPKWKDALEQAPAQLRSTALYELDLELGTYFGGVIRHFCKEHELNPDLIGSHGHTAAHDPPKYTVQIGKGSAIEISTGVPVVSDFRIKDVLLGGQGAPLAPIGDEYLFGEYDYCLNLGGIANISATNVAGHRIAYDVTPCNIVLNQLAQELGNPYDPQGKLASAGIANQALFNRLMELDYFKQQPPKSLDKEASLKMIWAFLDQSKFSLQDQLATMVAVIAAQIAKAINDNAPIANSKCFVTGGGAWNDYLLDQIQKQTDVAIHVPTATVVDYKEALIFAFMALLKIKDQNNVLASVTGAPYDHCSGSIDGDLTLRG